MSFKSKNIHLLFVVLTALTNCHGLDQYPRVRGRRLKHRNLNLSDRINILVDYSYNLVSDKGDNKKMTGGFASFKEQQNNANFHRNLKSKRSKTSKSSKEGKNGKGKKSKGGKNGKANKKAKGNGKGINKSHNDDYDYDYTDVDNNNDKRKSEDDHDSPDDVDDFIRDQPEDDHDSPDDVDDLIRDYHDNYLLDVINGSGDGDYKAGTRIDIAFESCQEGKEFKRWEFLSGVAEIDDIYSSTTTLTMPKEDIQVKAMCKLIHSVTEPPTTILEIITEEPTYEDNNDELVVTEPPTTIVERITEEPTHEDNNDAPVVTEPPTAIVESIPEEPTYEDNNDELIDDEALNECGMTDEKRSKEIMSILKEISKNKLLSNETTPQYMAAQWIIEQDDYYLCPGFADDAKISQRYILSVFYFITQGDDWKECFYGDENCGKNDNNFSGQTYFLSPSDECEWAGIQCNDDLFVEAILFEEGNNVAGSLPDEIGHLDNLEVLSLDSQNIGGELPAAIGDLANLKVIDLDFNQLTGKIPDALYGLTQLEQIELNHNDLRGTLSNEIGNMTQLTFLLLNNNRFRGTFPDTLVYIPLVIAQFQFNDFEGKMPLCLGAPWQTIEVLGCDCDTGDVTCDVGCGCECF